MALSCRQNRNGVPALLLLVLNACIQFLGLAADECGTRFVDPESSAVLANVVFEGSMGNMDTTTVQHHSRWHSANVTIDRVIKGMEVLKGMGIPLEGSVMVDKFGAEEDRDNCVASVSGMISKRKHLFFSRPSSQLRGVLQMTALPLPAEVDVISRVKRSICDNCVQPPQITRVRCRQCARPPVIKRVKARKVTMGKRGRIRCTAFGYPRPTFSWSKDGLPVTSGAGGISVSSSQKLSTLTIRRVTSAHAGRYMCMAQNSVGRAERDVVLKIDKRQRRPQVQYNVHNAPDRRECSSSTLCLNGGTCFYSPSLDLRVCECGAGFEGVRCENLVGSIYNVSSSGDVSTFTSSSSVRRLWENERSNEERETQTSQVTTQRSSTSDGNRSFSVVSTTVFSTTNGGDVAIVSAPSTEKVVVTSSVMQTPTTSSPVRQFRTPKPGKGRRKSKPNFRSRARRPTSRKQYSNVDGEALKLIRSRINENALESVPCQRQIVCLNGGSCLHIKSLGVSICQCQAGYTGVRCQTSVSM